MKPDLRTTLRKPEVMRLLGVSSTTLEDLVTLKLLDPPFRLTPNGRNVGWDSEAVARYQADRRKEIVSYNDKTPRVVAMKQRMKAAPQRKTAKQR